MVRSLLKECNLGTHKGDLVVYRRSGEILGCAACAGGDDRFDWWLNCVAVKKASRDQGIGSLLIRYWCEQVPAGSSLWLETYYCHRALYERIGFIWVPASQRSEFFHEDPRTHKNTILMAWFNHAIPEAIIQSEIILQQTSEVSSALRA